MKAIKSKAEYKKIMAEILSLMNKGEANVTIEESNKIRKLALAAHIYEKDVFATSHTCDGRGDD